MINFILSFGRRIKLVYFYKNHIFTLRYLSLPSEPKGFFIMTYYIHIAMILTRIIKNRGKINYMDARIVPEPHNKKVGATFDRRPPTFKMCDKFRVENVNSGNFYFLPTSNVGEGQQLNFS